MLDERHARATAALLAAARVDFWSGKVAFLEWLDRIEIDRENAWIALALAVRAGAFDLVLAMTPVLLMRSRQGTTYDARAAIAETVDRGLETRAPQRAQLAARTQLMRFCIQRRLPYSVTVGREALSLAEACGDRFAIYLIEAWSVRTYIQLGDLDAAAAAITLVDALEDPAWPAIRLVPGAEACSVFEFVKGPPGAALEPLRQDVRPARLAVRDTGLRPAISSR